MITGRPRLATGGGTVAAGRPNPELSSLVDTDVYVYYGNAGAAEPNDADTWNADYGVVYHLKEDPAGTAPRPRTARNNAVHGTCDISGAIVQDNTLWGGKCILFDSGPRLRVEDNPAIENANRITIEAWVNTLSWPSRAVVCRKDGSYILYNYSGGFSWYLFGPDNRLQYDIAGVLEPAPAVVARHPPAPRLLPRRTHSRRACCSRWSRSSLYRSTVVRHRVCIMRPGRNRVDRRGPGRAYGSRGARRSRSGCRFL